MSQGNVGVAGAKDRIAKIVEDVDSLPSLPSIVVKLIEVVNTTDSSAEDAAELIEKDPALTSKMIRLANSAFYGIPRSISSVTSAVVVLGFNTIRSLVLSASVAKMFNGKHALDMDSFWKHSVITAMSAKIIVRHLMSVRMMDPESAFCAGVLHDIGKLIFSQYMPEDYSAVCKYAKEKNIPIVEVEDKVFGVNHAKMGKILADRWSLPLDLEYAIVHHHDPENADKAAHLANIIHLADIITHKLGCNLWDGEVHMQESVKCRSELKIGDADFAKIMTNIENSLDKSQEFLAMLQ
ncbi:MAG: HDOD domain-containing protein [Chitinispirillia bacterium]|nr:HDOD domain-containing protein [Chitinispirillia bacterium]MCL2241977.1 HDOD domain-containing protein [Chitinispirillia bacterium]